MQNWVGVVVAIALVMQVSILIALFLQTRRTMQRVEKTVTDLNDRAGPILTRVQILLDDTQPKISTMVSDAAHIVYLARGQAQKVEQKDAAEFLRAAVPLLYPKQRFFMGKIEDQRGFDWILPPEEPVEKAEKEKEDKNRPPDAPSLRKRPDN